jgi:hypothetical protein
MDSQIETNTKPVETGRKEHRSHPRLVVFLVCLAISIMMWLFIELMKDYNDEIKYSITFSNVPKDLVFTNSDDTLISIGMRAQGFELLAAKYAKRNRTLEVDLSTLKIRRSDDGFTAFLPSARIIEQLGDQIRFEKEIIYVKPDTLFFRFSEIVRKQFSVKADVSYSVNPQYDITDSITFYPQYVTVSSTKEIIDTLTFVQTQKLNLNEIDSSVKMKVALFKGPLSRLIKYSPDSVTIQMNVAKVTEASYVIPVSILGNGENVKIFPDKVELICRVPLSEYSHVTKSDFAAEIEFRPELKNGNKLTVRLIKKPENVRVLKIVPEEVEFIIISK